MSKSWSRWRTLAGGALIAYLAGTGSANAGIVWAEQAPGAGDTIATAQVTSDSSLRALDAITGTLNAVVDQSNTPAYFADIFKIYISDTSTFSARTVSNNPQDDTSLFLFNSGGLGVAMNDDELNVGVLSVLSALNGLINDYYYIAIGLGGFEAQDGSPQNIFSLGGYTDVRAGDPNAGALVSWADPFARQAETTFDYRIEFTGARVAVPEPGTLALVLLAAAGVVGSRSTRRPAQA
jgi:hypothetical protein